MQTMKIEEQSLRAKSPASPLTADTKKTSILTNNKKNIIQLKHKLANGPEEHKKRQKEPRHFEGMEILGLTDINSFDDRLDMNVQDSDTEDNQKNSTLRETLRPATIYSYALRTGQLLRYGVPDSNFITKKEQDEAKKDFKIFKNKVVEKQQENKLYLEKLLARGSSVQKKKSPRKKVTMDSRGDESNRVPFNKAKSRVLLQDNVGDSSISTSSIDDEASEAANIEQLMLNQKKAKRSMQSRRMTMVNPNVAQLSNAARRSSTIRNPSVEKDVKWQSD